MRKLQLKEASKFIIESFKDDTSSKLQFMIDLDYVEQVDTATPNLFFFSQFNK